MIPTTETIRVVSVTSLFPSPRIKVIGTRNEDSLKRFVEVTVDYLQCPTLISDMKDGGVELEIPRGRWAYNLDWFRAVRGGTVGESSKPTS